MRAHINVSAMAASEPGNTAMWVSWNPHQPFSKFHIHNKWKNKCLDLHKTPTLPPDNILQSTSKERGFRVKLSVPEHPRKNIKTQSCGIPSGRKGRGATICPLKTSSHRSVSLTTKCLLRDTGYTPGTCKKKKSFKSSTEKEGKESFSLGSAEKTGADQDAW